MTDSIDDSEEWTMLHVGDTAIPVKDAEPDYEALARDVERHQDGIADEFDAQTDTDATKDTMSNTNTDAPLEDDESVHIHSDDPMLVTRAGTTYQAWDIDGEGEPVGDPWPLTEGAVRGLLGRHDWTKVEATASVRGEGDE